MRIACCLLFLALLVGLVTPGPPARGDLAAPSRPFGLSTPAFEYASSASCAAAACHGNGKTGGVGGEHSTWAPDLSGDGPGDPHARAHRVLFNRASEQMTRLL